MALSRQEFEEKNEVQINQLGHQRAELVVIRKSDMKTLFRTEVSMPKDAGEITAYSGQSEEQISQALADSAIKAYESFFGLID